MLAYTYRLDTGIPFDLEEIKELRERKIKVLWCQLAFLFFEKGRALQLKYWPGDLAMKDGYSSFGIADIKQLANQTNQTIDLDGLCILRVDLTDHVKNFVLHNIHKSEGRLSPFFHFEVLDEAGESLCTSQDFGSAILMALTVSDMRLLVADGFDLNFLISLPESG
ncbi:hypothetical protein QWY14_03530 [Planococcus sp. N028]|uniref:Uncharacterized protein n=1 Tax=Planococcus shixiaomingii TaxID=3058393 RepID=A0ABT8MZ03_9BACL|nr:MULTISPECIES: hypothetical protein [unclassified Planococcus (in: firmicutes)]MDN7240843.1 hypothetical protein [Planococcus sp. N028]WKA53087.1 hypothetical protein QWY21_10465 [Planococcus sp. N022]